MRVGYQTACGALVFATVAAIAPREAHAIVNVLVGSHVGLGGASVPLRTATPAAFALDLRLGFHLFTDGPSHFDLRGDAGFMGLFGPGVFIYGGALSVAPAYFPNPNVGIAAHVTGFVGVEPTLVGGVRAGAWLQLFVGLIGFEAGVEYLRFTARNEDSTGFYGTVTFDPVLLLSGLAGRSGG